MPDRDIFSTNLKRNWIKPARLMFNPLAESVFVDSSLRSLSRDVGSDSLLGFERMVDIVVEARFGPSNSNTFSSAHRQLDEIRLDYLGNTCGIMKSVFKRLLLSNNAQFENPSTISKNRMRVMIGSYGLAMYADASMCPIPVLERLQKSGMRSAEIRERRTAAIDSIASDTRTQSLAEQLANGTEGRRRRVLKLRRPSTSQSELLSLNLTTG